MSPTTIPSIQSNASPTIFPSPTSSPPYSALQPSALTPMTMSSHSILSPSLTPPPHHPASNLNLDLNLNVNFDFGDMKRTALRELGMYGLLGLGTDLGIEPSIGGANVGGRKRSLDGSMKFESVQDDRGGDDMGGQVLMDWLSELRSPYPSKMDMDTVRRNSSGSGSGTGTGTGNPLISRMLLNGVEKLKAASFAAGTYKPSTSASISIPTSTAFSSSSSFQQPTNLFQQSIPLPNSSSSQPVEAHAQGHLGFKYYRREKDPSYSRIVKGVDPACLGSPPMSHDQSCSGSGVGSGSASGSQPISFSNNNSRCGSGSGSEVDDGLDVTMDSDGDENEYGCEDEGASWDGDLEEMDIDIEAKSILEARRRERPVSNPHTPSSSNTPSSTNLLKPNSRKRRKSDFPITAPNTHPYLSNPPPTRRSSAPAGLPSFGNRRSQQPPGAGRQLPRGGDMTDGTSQSSAGGRGQTQTRVTKRRKTEKKVVRKKR